MKPDICLVVEGTYPYVTGGVSTWLHNLIVNSPEFTFTVLHLGVGTDSERVAKYEFPPNVVGFQEVLLNDFSSLRQHGKSNGSPDNWQLLRSLHQSMAESKFEESFELFKCIHTAETGQLEATDLLFSPEAWKLLVERYQAQTPSSPFLDYFWAFRATHLPLFVLNNASFPEARIYHTLSTGYAGYAAGLAKLQTGAPLLITEHGVYTRERDLEIAIGNWVPTVVQHPFRVDPEIGVFKAWWISMFHFLARLTYRMSDCIISITEVNQQYELRDGAEPGKMRVIPNGIDVSKFKHLRASNNSRQQCFTVGFVGRVVSIKDVKTFIQAIKIAGATVPHLMALIVGPTDEEKDYFTECQELVALLQLSEVVSFTGHVNVLERYQEIDVLVLTSLSEAQPLVVLEANCAGIPVVAPDVGACRELLEGATSEDRAIGPSGLLTLPASPDQTAEAIIRLWKDQSLRRELARAGQERVQRFYREEAVYASYKDLYQRYLHSA